MARRFRQLIRAFFASFVLILPVCRAALAAPGPSPAFAAPTAPLAAQLAALSGPSAGPSATPSAATRLAPPDASPAPKPGATIPAPKIPRPSPTPDAWEQARRYFEQLSPDQKGRFRDNLAQWETMPPAEQNLFRDRELFHRQKAAQEIEDAVNKSGLKLDEDRREVYALRYTQERRKIEDQLRKEMDQKRKGLVADMLRRLKAEFAPVSAVPSATTAPPAPAPSAP